MDELHAVGNPSNSLTASYFRCLKVLSIYADYEVRLEEIQGVHVEVRDEFEKHWHDNMFLVYARDEVELHMRIADIATTKAKNQKFLGVEKRSHGLTIRREHVPATVTMPEERHTDGK